MENEAQASESKILLHELVLLSQKLLALELNCDCTSAFNTPRQEKHVTK